jgi:hypothetical protein
MWSIELRSAPPVSAVALDVEITIGATITARKGRKTASVVLCQITADCPKPSNPKSGCSAARSATQICPPISIDMQT